MELSIRVKELRAQQGLSQEELARQTGLSLRTIQRIEQNETEARGDTLKRLSEVFKLKPADLIIAPNKYKTNSITLLNISALSFIIYPVLGFIVPLVLWYFRHKDDDELDRVGKKLINFQATWTLAITIIYTFIIVSKIMHFGGQYTLYSSLIIPYGLFAANFLLIVFNAFRIKAGKAVIYQPAIPFFGKPIKS